MVGLYFFLILFGGFEFVRTFAAKNDGTITCRLERVQASVVTAFFFCYINFMLFSVCHFAFELYFYTVPRCFVNGEITWRHGGCLMGLNRDWTGFEQGLFNGCSMVVQWLFNGCHHLLWSLVSAEGMNAAAVSVSSPMSFGRLGVIVPLATPSNQRIARS